MSLLKPEYRGKFDPPQPYTCPKCHKSFTGKSTGIGCLVMHQPGDCCHYSEVEVKPKYNHTECDKAIQDNRPSHACQGCQDHMFPPPPQPKDSEEQTFVELIRDLTKVHVSKSQAAQMVGNYTHSRELAAKEQELNHAFVELTVVSDTLQGDQKQFVINHINKRIEKLRSEGK